MAGGLRRGRGIGERVGDHVIAERRANLRQEALSRRAGYLDDRARRGRSRRFEDGAVAARIVLETLVFWAVHRHWDPSPQAVDDDSSRRTVLAFLISALVKEAR